MSGVARRRIAATVLLYSDVSTESASLRREKRLVNDLRFAVRLLRHNPGFAAATILTLAIGVGLNAAVFTLVRAVLLRPLPLVEPDRVAVLWTERPDDAPSARGRSDVPEAAGMLADWRADNQSFDAIAGIELWKDTLAARFVLGPDVEIVGVVGDVRTKSLAEPPPPAYYLARAQAPSELVCLVIRAVPRQSRAVTAATLRAIHRIDPLQPVERIATLDQIASDSISDRRFHALVTAAFAVVGLLLAVIGLAGILARYTVERAREIALRMALGADPASVRRLVVSQALAPVLAGLAAGVLGSLWLTR